MSNLNVKVRIVFDVNYVINSDLYDTDDKARVLDMEREYVADSPALMVSLFKHKGTFSTSVEVNDG